MGMRYKSRYLYLNRSLSGDYSWGRGEILNFSDILLGKEFGGVSGKCGTL